MKKIRSGVQRGLRLKSRWERSLHGQTTKSHASKQTGCIGWKRGRRTSVQALLCDVISQIIEHAARTPTLEQEIAKLDEKARGNLQRWHAKTQDELRLLHRDAGRFPTTRQDDSFPLIRPMDSKAAPVSAARSVGRVAGRCGPGTVAQGIAQLRRTTKSSSECGGLLLWLCNQGNHTGSAYKRPSPKPVTTPSTGFRKSRSAGQIIVVVRSGYVETAQYSVEHMWS